MGLEGRISLQIRVHRFTLSISTDTSSTTGVIQKFAPDSFLKHTLQRMVRVTLIRTSHSAVWTWVVGNERSR